MSYLDLFAGFSVNLVFALIIVRGIYYPAKQDKDYIFTFLAFNTVIYFVVAFMTSAEISVGVGFGLFAIFSVLRYRTSTMSTRAMTYLFIVIALPVMNSFLIRIDGWPVLMVINSIVVVVLFVLERGWGFHYESSKMVKYDRIELIAPQHHASLLEDLRQRTGLPVKRVIIGRINFLEDSADLRIYYDEETSRPWLGDDAPDEIESRNASDDD
jgi:hypothetical protein